MFLIAWELDGKKDWEVVDGEDAMQIRVCELVEKHGMKLTDIVVGDMSDYES